MSELEQAIAEAREKIARALELMRNRKSIQWDTYARRTEQMDKDLGTIEACARHEQGKTH